MTRKEELELKAAQWLQHHGDQRLTQPLAALLEQVEREVLSRISARMAMVVESKETPCTSGSEPNNRS